MTKTTEQTHSQSAQPASQIVSEVLEKPARRRFTADYKQRILAEADACARNRVISANLLRREGLYGSHLSMWRSQREQAVLEGLSHRRGRKAQDKNPLALENARLQKEVKRLQDRLTQAHTIIDVQKKLIQLLGLNETLAHNEHSS